MLSGDIARDRIADRMREAEAERRAAAVRHDRAGRNPSRRTTSGLLAALTGLRPSSRHAGVQARPA
jgi:hypothetical protein